MESTTTEAIGNISERNCQEYGGLARSVIFLSLDGGELGSILLNMQLTQTHESVFDVLLYPAWHKIRASYFRTPPLHLYGNTAVVEACN
jgi:hypothetical protein